MQNMVETKNLISRENILCPRPMNVSMVLLSAESVFFVTVELN